MPKGTLVIRAAELIGVQIPRFCDHPLLDPVGACRQCLVEVEGQRKPMASCTITVHRDMVVRTQYTLGGRRQGAARRDGTAADQPPAGLPDVRQGRRVPAAEPGDVQRPRRDPLRRTSSARSPSRSTSPSQVLLDRERCVLCARCTRFSDQIAGDPFIELLERGALQQVGIARRASRSSRTSPATPCRSARSGALTGTAYRFRARPFDLVSSPSVCEHCASGCAQRTDHRRGKVLRRLAGDDPEVNEEWNCDKGRWAFTYATQGDRITTPLVRDDDGKLRPASWSEAIAVAVAGLTAARGSAGVLVGGRVTVEDAYAYAEVRPNRVGHQRHRLPRPPAQRRGGRSSWPRRVAGQPMTVTYADLESAPAVLLAGLRARRGVADRVPAAAQGRPQARRCRCTPIAPFATRGLTKMRGTLIETRARRRGRRARRAGRRRRDCCLPGAIILVGERLATLPRRVLGRGPAGRRAPAPGWPGCRAAPASAARWRPARCRACCPAAGPRRRRPPARRSPPRWHVDRVADRPGRDTDGDPGRRRATVTLGALLVGGVEPADLPDPDAALAALDAAPFVVSLELRRQRGDRTRRRGVPGRAGRRRRRAHSSTGRAGSGRSSRRCRTNATPDLPGAATPWPTRWASTSACPRVAAARGTGRDWALGRPAARRPDVAAAAAAPSRARVRRCWPAGGCCSTTGGCRTASRIWPAPRAHAGRAAVGGHRGRDRRRRRRPGHRQHRRAARSPCR